MNPYTGHLVDNEKLEMFRELERESYKPVPDNLRSDAKQELRGKSETYVDLDGDSDLAKWAEEIRLQGSKNEN